MKLKHFKTSLLALATTVGTLSGVSIALTSCGASHITIDETSKTQALDSSGCATYTFTLDTEATSASEFNTPTISNISNEKVKLTASIESVSGKTLKVKVSQTGSNELNGSATVTFSLTIEKKDGSWSQTISNLKITNAEESETYSVSYTSISGITFSRKPTYVAKGSDLVINFTINNGYELDTINSKVTVGGTDVTSSCQLTTVSLTVPASVITGNVSITIKTESAVYTSYSITYNSPSGLTWTTKPSATAELRAVTIQYTLNTGYAIDTTKSDITVGGTSIKSSITYNSGTISIPAEYVTGDIVITLITKTATTYTVTYDDSGEQTGLTWISKPNKATSGAVFTATYSLSSGRAIDESNSVIKVGGTNITQYVTFGNGTIIIAADYVTDYINIKLVTMIEDDTHAYTGLTGGTIAEKTKSGLTTYTLEAADTTGATPLYITLSGKWLNSSIKIATSGTYNITLNNCTISNFASTETDAAIPFNITKNANGAVVNIILATNSENTINDKRSATISYEDDMVIRHNDSTGTGSLNFSGAGVLNINNVNSNKGAYTKGIQTKTNVTISDGATINAFAYDTAIQAGGSLLIDNANVIADSYYGDAIKTKSLDPDEDLNWTGTRNIGRDITVKGNSNVTTYSARHGFNAAHNFITKYDGGSPTINVSTGYANAGSKVASNDKLDEQNLYIAVPSSAIKYSDIENFYFAIDFYASESSSSILKTEVMSLKKIRKDNGYYFFKCDRPLDSGYGAFKINKYAIDQFGAESPTATASSDYFTISSPASTSYTDCVKISTISGTTISGTFDQNYYYLKENDSKASKKIDTVISSKGIKANNSISLPVGTINLKTLDTCMSCGYGDIFCNSSTAGSVTFGSGDITLSGANVTGASSSGDGVKAYGTMNVTNGNIEITKSVEALEAGKINLSGGIIKLSASDDGLNASQCGKYNTSMVSINISGGILDVQTTSTNDTDAVDSNNTLSISGGLIIARVPGNDSSTSLDWESGDVTIENATIILMGKADTGGPGQSKSLGGGTTYTSCTGIGGMNSSGSHTVTYYTSSSSKSSYVYNNNQTMNSTKTIMSNFSAPSFS